MKNLNLTLKRKWFDMIAARIKLEEYREIKPYWIQRLCWHEYHKCSPEVIKNYVQGRMDVLKRNYDVVTAKNGYAKDAPAVTWEHKGIRIGEGRAEWGAEPGVQYFVLEIGELIEQP